jgi:hypothetical protein
MADWNDEDENSDADAESGDLESQEEIQEALEILGYSPEEVEGMPALLQLLSDSHLCRCSPDEVVACFTQECILMLEAARYSLWPLGLEWKNIPDPGPLPKDVLP